MTTGKTARRTRANHLPAGHGRGRAGGLRAAARALALGLGLGLAGAGAAAAESGYGCRNLVYSDVVPAVEGEAGTFFRIHPDLETFHWIEAESVDGLARLSRILAQHGTTLVYVPVPTKALAMPDALPLRAADLGYDPDLAASVFDEMLDRLEGAGIRTVDSRRALRAAALEGQAPFFGPDHRLSADGTRALANAVAQALGQAEDLQALPRATFRTTQGPVRAVPSLMRLQLQHHCVATLPEVQAPLLETVAAGGGTPARIAVVGTEVAIDPATHFAGFLASYTGFSAASYAVPGGDAYAAIATYLTSPAFRAQRPQVLVWTNPVWKGLGLRGDQPMAELIAAASTGCTAPLRLATDDRGRLRADLQGLPASTVLQFDTGGGAATRAAFHFLAPDGQRRTRWIARPPQPMQSGRFFMPMTGLWPAGAAAVEIETDIPPGIGPSLVACREG